jgi:uroporphyrinogen-III decarboxylase
MSTPRQNIEAALSADGTSHIPVVICYEGIYVRDHWPELTNAPWWHESSPDVAQQMAWRNDVLARSAFDWFELPGFLSARDRAALAIEERAGGIYHVNRRTGAAKRLEKPTVSGWAPGAGTQSIHPVQLPQTEEEIDAVLPLPPAFDPAQAAPDDLAQALCDQQPARYPLGYVAAPLWLTYHLWGFEGMMEMIATQPRLVLYACERFMAHGVRAIREAACQGAAGIWIEDCLTDMISERDFRALNVPFLRRLNDEIQQAGMQSIHYFCGNPAGKWQALLEIGTDALALEESKKGFRIDIAEVAERVNGRCALLGNLDAIHLLPDAAEDALKAEIERQMEAGRRNGGRFVMSIGSPVTPGTSVSRVRRYCDLARELASAR